MTIDEMFNELEDKARDTFIVTLKYKYDFEKNYTIENHILEYDSMSDSYVWLNDWNEGQTDVEVLGYMPIGDVDTTKLEPSEDCISREALKQALQAHCNFFIISYGGYENMSTKEKARVDEIDNCIAMVINAPSVTPSYNSINTELKPSEDCISRQYLIEKATSWDKHFADSERYVSLTDIQKTPSVIPQTKRGHWIAMSEGFTPYECSECESVEFKKSKYCPNCGCYCGGDDMSMKAYEKMIDAIDFAIKATDSQDDYSMGMRNGMRYVKSLIDSKEPHYELRRTDEEIKLGIDLGDEVVGDYGSKGVVVGIDTYKGKVLLSLLTRNHKVPQLVEASRYKKTGRHFDAIEKLYEEMEKGGADGK